MAGRLD